VIEKKEFSDVFIENRVLIVAIGIFVLFVVIMGGVYNSISDKNSDERLVKIFKFKEESLVKYQNKGLSDVQYVDELVKFSKEIGSSVNLFPLYIDSVDTLIKNRSLEKALEVLNSAEATFASKNEYMLYFIFVRKAVVLEDLNKVDEAIDLLKKLSSSPLKILPGKPYLDMGRLYLKKGDSVNAKVNFEYVVNNYGAEEFAKLAKAFLSEIN